MSLLPSSRAGAARWLNARVLILVLGWAAPAVGQRPAAPPEDLSRVISVDAHVRLRTGGGETLEGRVTAVDAGSVTLDQGGRTRRIAHSSVERAWIRTSKTAALAAGGASLGGAGLGLMFGTLGSGLCDAAVCDGAFTEGFMWGAVAGAGLGAGVGAAVGSLLHEWRAVPETPDDDPGPRRRVSASLRYGAFRATAAGAPPGTREVAASVGLRMGRERARSVGLELAHLDFEPTQEVVPAGPRLDDEVSMASLSAVATEESILDGALRVSAAAGVVRSTLDRVRTPFWDLDETTRRRTRDWGIRIGGSLSGGWENGNGALHTGFTLRADWITGSVVGSTPVLSLSVSAW